jgi:hypothetical protein
MKLFLVFAILSLSAFAQSIVPIPNYVPGSARVIPIPNYTGDAIVIMVDEPTPDAVVPGVPVPPAIVPAPPVPPPPAKLSPKARFSKTVKAVGMVALVVVILAARVYVAGHAF